MASSKSNKSYLKRIKITRKGKLIARKPGQDHFNAKESSKTKLAKGRTQKITLTHKAKSLYLAHK